MGEWSKKIGEYGENVVEKFLSIIGWNNVQKGIEIKCFDKEYSTTLLNGQPQNPYTKEEVNMIIDESERQLVEGKYKTHEEAFKELFEEQNRAIFHFFNCNIPPCPALLQYVVLLILRNKK